MSPVSNVSYVSGTTTDLPLLSGSYEKQRGFDITRDISLRNEL
jgi:hypothetical protein